jgi:RNA recognition motif-containing protein
MAKKSAAQIRRMEQRASERGTTYEAPPASDPASALAPTTNKNEESNSSKKDSDSSKVNAKYQAALKLKQAIDAIETNTANLNSKDKRSAKRKAEAIALEIVKEHGAETDADIAADALLEWLEAHKKESNSQSPDDDSFSKQDLKLLMAAKKYQDALKGIEDNQELNSKDRRSAKKKTEAIAKEESGMDDIQQLLTWLDDNKDLEMQHQQQSNKKRKAKDLEDAAAGSKKVNPYILFVGQIPFKTTADEVFEHFQKYMGKKIITKEAMKIRIPKDDKAKDKSKGFAFVEFEDPEIMYECLKMHHTPMNGRRINVIRSAGGGKAARAEKHKQRKLEQDEYISSTVEKIIKDYIDQGDLKEGELDNGAMLLCKRRSAATVEAALAQYIEQRGDKELDNPSAFFTCVMCKVTDEGVQGAADGRKKQGGKGRGNNNGNASNKEPRSRDASVFTKSGVDMSISEKNNTGDAKLSEIFPSMGRGRGRGRGAYMR